MSATAARSLPTLRRYVLFWFAGCAALMVVAYTQLLDYYFERGVDLRTEAFLERTARSYASASAMGSEVPLPTGPGLLSYRRMDDLPKPIRSAFDLDDLQDRRVATHFNRDFGDDDVITVDSLNLCPEGQCDLIFLYPYRLEGDEWLYLVHGVVATDEIFDEFMFTERVALAVGGLFTVLLGLVSLLVIRGIDGPLRKLDRWSAELSVSDADPEVPDLRFREFDALATRLNFAFEGMREGVEKEALFLRHASHELRTPLAVLSANAELIERLTARPDRTTQEEAAFLRQARALEEVRQLIEILLWLNRQTDTAPEQEALDLRQAVDEIVDQHRHLLDDRQVALRVEGDGTVVVAPAAAARIVIANLVRNAFQHTIDGVVHVSVEGSGVRIENHGRENTDGIEVDGEFSFGLGLELVRRTCERFGWSLRTNPTAEGWVSIVLF